MKKIERSEILDLGAYEAIRDRFKSRIIEMKKRRRTAVGEHMTLIWENRDTVLFQIQEMLRTERITNERGIAHEIETYNDLIPGSDELSATLMIEYEDAQERAQAGDRLAGLGDHVWIVVGGTRAKARFVEQAGEDASRQPLVNYLRFTLAPEAAAKLATGEGDATIEITHPAYTVRAAVSEATRRELADDLAS